MKLSSEKIILEPKLEAYKVGLNVINEFELYSSAIRSPENFWSGTLSIPLVIEDSKSCLV